MPWTHVAWLSHWLQGGEPLLPIIAGLISIGILFGCAVASWIAPPEEKDGIFHRQVV